MPYTNNPHMPRVRIEAVKLVKSGWSIRKTSRHTGFAPSTISRWVKKAPDDMRKTIPTKKPIPKKFPKKLAENIISRIVALRKQTNGRCSEVIHQLLINEGIKVSLSSVKRTLSRNYLLKTKSPWKKYHQSGMRPKAENTGDLVQIDTIHLMLDETRRIYVYTLLDVYSRWAYAYATDKISAGKTVGFLTKARKKSEFEFKCIQSDHGPEFSQHFTRSIDTKHRHSRVRKPNDNAHLERFNRTLQDEFLKYLPIDVKVINRQLPKYLKYYNQERLHLGLNLQTPSQVLRRC